MRSPVVRPFRSDEWPLYRSLRLAALAESPDAFGSVLSYETPRPEAEWERRLAAGVASSDDLPLMAEVGGTPCGLAWGRVDATDTTVGHVYQMWVAPSGRGRGAGARLLETIIQWAKDRGLRELRIGVTCGDSAASRLYAKAGFVPVGSPTPLRPNSPLRRQLMCLALPSSTA